MASEYQSFPRETVHEFTLSSDVAQFRYLNQTWGPAKSSDLKTEVQRLATKEKVKEVGKPLVKRAMENTGHLIDYWAPNSTKHLIGYFVNNAEKGSPAGPWSEEYAAFMKKPSNMKNNPAKFQQLKDELEKEHKKRVEDNKPTVWARPPKGISLPKTKKPTASTEAVHDDDDDDNESSMVPVASGGPASGSSSGKSKARLSSSGKGKAPAQSSGQASPGAAGAGPAAPRQQLPVHGSKAMVESIKGNFDIFARYSKTQKYMYCLAVPQVQVKTYKPAMEALGYASYKDVVAKLLGFGVAVKHEQYALDIFACDHGYNTLSLCGFTYIHLPIDPRLTPELAKFAVPIELAEMRAEHLASFNRDLADPEKSDDDADDNASAIYKAWETFKDSSAHEEFWKALKETKRLDTLEAAYKRSFDRYFMSKQEFDARKLLAEELKAHLRLNDAQHEANTENQIKEIMMNGGVREGKPLDRQQFIRYLEIFAGSLPTLRPDGFSRQTIADYLDERDNVIRKCEKLTEEGYIAAQEGKHKKSFPDIIRSEQHSGIWALYKAQYKAYKIALKQREEADKKAAEEKQKLEDTLKERDEMIAQLQLQLAAQGNIQASTHDQQAAGGPADPKRRRVSGPSRPRTRPPTPPENFTPKKDTRESNPPPMFRAGTKK
jgi:plasmid stability protein